MCAVGGTWGKPKDGVGGIGEGEGDEVNQERLSGEGGLL
jgi:hypothetical protein